MSAYAFFPDVTKQATIPEKGILSRTLHQDEKLKIILFGFAQGEELSEHTAQVPAVLHFLEGRAQLKLGDDVMNVNAGSLAHMPANLTHAIKAETPVLMLLYMQKSTAAKPSDQQ